MKEDYYIDKNYKLSDGSYFHFHETLDGYDYTIYDSSKNELDGGILETNSNNEKEILKELSIFTGLNELLTKDIIELNEEIELKRCQNYLFELYPFFEKISYIDNKLDDKEIEVMFEGFNQIYKQIKLEPITENITLKI